MAWSFVGLRGQARGFEVKARSAVLRSMTEIWTMPKRRGIHRYDQIELRKTHQWMTTLCSSP